MTTLAPEDAERAQIDALARTLGITRVNLSEKRRSRLHPGLPDAYYQWPRKNVAFWFEAKKPRGQLTREQHAFLVDELACHRLACCGTFADFVTLTTLVTKGLAHFAVLRRCREIVDVWASKGYRAA